MAGRRGRQARQAQILAELGRGPSLRVAELARRLAVSTETIRRDLDALTERGLLNRTYGGAVSPPGREPALNERHRLLVAERERIARAASGLVRPGSLVLLGSGATTTHVARRLAVEHRNLTVITHAFGVATALSLNPTITVLLAPGVYQSAEGAVLGAHTLGFLGGFNADLAILGASGLTPEGPSDAQIASGTVYSAMVARSAATLLVADRSKFGAVFAARWASWNQIARLVTDAAPEGALAEALARHGVAVTVA